MSPPPEGDLLGVVVIAIGAFATTLAFALAAVWTLRPGEHDVAHVKYRILRNDR